MVDVDISMGVTIPGYNWGFGTQIIIRFTVLCNEVQVEDAGLQEILGRAVSQLYEALAVRLEGPEADVVQSLLCIGKR